MPQTASGTPHCSATGAQLSIRGTCRLGTRVTLPAGFGSGWDNCRGGSTAAASASAPQRSGIEQRAAASARDRFLAAVKRAPGEACRVPGALHERLAAGGSGCAAALCRVSCTVVAFSPDGTLLALAAEVTKGQWTVQVRRFWPRGMQGVANLTKAVMRCGPTNTAHVHTKPQRAVDRRCATW
jgi:hypothetical protein